MDGNAAEHFQFEKIFLYQMALFIQPPAATTLRFDTISGWDGWFPAIFIDIVIRFWLSYPLSVMYAVSVYTYMLQHRDGEIDVITLPYTKRQVDRAAISVYGCMDLGSGSPAPVSDSVWRLPFLPPRCAGGSLW